MNTFTQLDNNTFTTVNRGHHMTLVRISDGWEVTTVNAMSNAMNNGYAFPKYFPTLEAVEKKYKSWDGIVTLVALTGVVA